MFGKKILSLIGLFIVGSQISMVTAAAGAATGFTDDCSSITSNIEDTCASAGSYCFDGTNIYKYDSTSCKAKLGAGVYIFDNSNGKIDATNVVSGTAYNVYVCDSDSTCKRTYGYVMKNAENYFEIKHDGSEAAAPTATSKVAANCVAGELFKDSDATDAIKLCLAPGKGVAVGTTTDYFVTNSGSTIFTVSNNVASPKMVIQSSANAFVLNTVFTDEKYSDCNDSTTIIERKEQFCSGSILNILYSCTDGLCTVSLENIEGKLLVENEIYSCDDGSCSLSSDTGVFIFKDDPEDETYKLQLTDAQVASLTSDDLSRVHLYDCASGSCIVTSGYIKYDTSAKIAQFTNGNIANVDFTTQACGSGGDAGNINLATTTLSLCDASGTLKNSDNVGNNYGFLFGTDLYKITESIIAISNHAESYIDGDTKLTTCDGTDCQQVTAADGYYYVYALANGTSKALYLCTASSTCVSQTPGHGYYFNKDSTTTKKAVLCTNGPTCLETDDLTKSNCSSDKYKVIYETGLKYCNDGSEVAIPSDTSKSYYVVPNILDNSIDYPDSFATTENTNKIVIEVQKYSVTQYVNASAFCIHTTALVAEGECINDDDKYTCQSAASPCSVVKHASSPCTATTAEARCNGYYLDGSDLKISTNGVAGDALSLKCFFKSPSGIIIKCITSNGSAIVCSDVSAVTVTLASLISDDCTVGNIITDGDAYKLCVNGQKDDIVTIFTASSDKYFIEASIFYTGKESPLYSLISIDGTSVQVVNLQAGAKKYRYAYADQKALVKKANVCESGTGTLVEYSSPNDSEDTYTKSS